MCPQIGRRWAGGWRLCLKHVSKALVERVPESDAAGAADGAGETARALHTNYGEPSVSTNSWIFLDFYGFLLNFLVLLWNEPPL